MLNKLIIAIGIGITGWLIMDHQPTIICILNIILDVLLVLNFIEDKVECK